MGDYVKWADEAIQKKVFGSPNCVSWYKNKQVRKDNNLDTYLLNVSSLLLGH